MFHIHLITFNNINVKAKRGRRDVNSRYFLRRPLVTVDLTKDCSSGEALFILNWPHPLLINDRVVSVMSWNASVRNYGYQRSIIIKNLR